jgi:tetratricopeptide (TPR) repeat protein
MRTALALACALTLALGAVSGARAADEQVEIELHSLDRYRGSAHEFQLGLAAQRRGDLEVAAEHYGRAIESDADFVEAMANLARVEIARGDWDEAERWIDRAVAAEPDYPRAWGARGLLGLARGEIPAAIDDLTRAAALDPGDLEVQVNLGAALLRRGLAAKAREPLIRALQIDPDDATALYDLALAEDEAGDHERALLLYRRFLALAASESPARAGAARRVDELGAAVAQVSGARESGPATDSPAPKPKRRRGALR